MLDIYENLCIFIYFSCIFFIVLKKDNLSYVMRFSYFQNYLLRNLYSINWSFFIAMVILLCTIIQSLKNFMYMYFMSNLKHSVISHWSNQIYLYPFFLDVWFTFCYYISVLFFQFYIYLHFVIVYFFFQDMYLVFFIYIFLHYNFISILILSILCWIKLFLLL